MLSDLRDDLVHLVVDIMRRLCGISSAVVWWFLLHDLRRFVATRPTEIDNERIGEAVNLVVSTIRSNKVKKRFAAIKELSIRLSEASYSFCYMQSMAACLTTVEAPLLAVLESLGANEKELWIEQVGLLEPTIQQDKDINPYFLDDLGPNSLFPLPDIRVSKADDGKSPNEQIVADLRENIAKSNIPIGGMLPTTRELATALNASEDGVKLALVELRALEMLAPDMEGRDRLDSYKPKSPVEALVESILAQPYAVESVFDFRIPIEYEIVSSAAQNANPAELSELENIISRMGEICATDATEFAKLDSQFHAKLAQAADRDGLSALYDGFLPIITKVTRHWLSKHSNRLGDNMRIHMQHLEIWNAVSTKNPSAAANAMRKHLEYVLTSLNEFERRSHFEQIASLRQHI